MQITRKHERTGGQTSQTHFIRFFKNVLKFAPLNTKPKTVSSVMAAEQLEKWQNKNFDKNDFFSNQSRRYFSEFKTDGYSTDTIDFFTHLRLRVRANGCERKLEI